MNNPRRIAILLIGTAMLGSCSLFQSETFVPSTIAALGDSITMGIQDAGLVESNQYNCYPYLIAKQMGQARGFIQPLVSSPGIGVPPYAIPLRLEDGFVQTEYLPAGITEEELMQLIVPKLQNLFYTDPYNNLGVNGARLDDLNAAKGYLSSSSHENFFYDLVLRNFELNGLPLTHFADQPTTAVEQAALLDPEYILLWIGNNDILGYVLSGGEKPELITGADTFQSELRAILTYLQGHTTAKIVLANIPEYLPFGYALDGVFVDGSPKLFDPTTLQPIDFTGSGGYIDLHIEPEDGGTVTHLLLTAAAAYIEKGMGIDPADLAGLTEQQKALLAGVTLPSVAVPLTKDLVLTDSETQTALDTIDDFNTIIASVAADPDISVPVVDANSLMRPETEPPLLPGDPMAFALMSQDNTRYSLDGIHPSNYGHAFIANEFIDTMNSRFGLNIPKLDPEKYKGQYSGKALVVPSLKAIRRLEEMYAPKK
jgi:lysophospholipase L1-like esterase